MIICFVCLQSSFTYSILSCCCIICIPLQLTRSCVELAKAWRTDKYLRKLEAVLLVADKDNIFELTGNGDVLEPQFNVMGVGSGGTYAQGKEQLNALS